MSKAQRGGPGVHWECPSLCAAPPWTRSYWKQVKLMSLAPVLEKYLLYCRKTVSYTDRLSAVHASSPKRNSLCLKHVKTLGIIGIKACERKAFKNYLFQSINKVRGLLLGFWHPPSSLLHETSGGAPQLSSCELVCWHCAPIELSTYAFFTE